MRSAQFSVVLATVFAGALGPLPLAAAGLPAPPRAEGRVTFQGNVHSMARPELEIGPTDPDLAMRRVLLLLEQRPGAGEELRRLLDAQQEPASERYHRWLTPEEFGHRFGISDQGLATVVGWLRVQGFIVGEAARGRGWIEFSGTTLQVSKAFATPIRDYRVAGRVHHANAADPSIPRELVGLVKGIVSLHDFPRRPLHPPALPITLPAAEAGGKHYLAPADFATIYDVKPLYQSGTTGAGIAIAIVGRSDLQLADVRYFRSFFGLPAMDPVIIHNGPAPGDLGGGEEVEADLDVQWSGAVAPQATINFVVSASTFPSDGVDLSAAYIVDHAVAPIVSESFGGCEAEETASTFAFDNSLWAQAAAEGITAFVASGDQGISLCADQPTVNHTCSTPYDVCVGGTQFADDPPARYWAPTPDPTTQASALSYIPEQAWNEPGIGASGGGASGVYAKPSWQDAPGVPPDGRRDVPDVALAAAGHDAYLVVVGHSAVAQGLFAVAGTSAAAPAFAGLMALVVQQAGGPQGNVNPALYQLARSQYGSAGPAVFHDITDGDNSVPGVPGALAGVGYDLVTGLGSVDAAALAAHWSAPPAPDFALAATPSDLSLAPGESVQVQIKLASFDGFASPVTLSIAALPPGVTAAFAPPTLSGAGSSSLLITTAKTAATGFVPLTLSGGGGGQTHTVPLSMRLLFPRPTIGPASSTGKAFALSLAAGPDDAVWFTALSLSPGTIGDQVGRITTAGVVTEFPIPNCPQQCFPAGIAGGPDGGVWITDVVQSRIDRFSTGGAVTTFALTPNSGPVPITAGPDGALWFLDYSTLNPGIGRLTTSGSLTSFPLPADDVPPPFFGVEPSITSGLDGAIWYTEPGSNRIGRITTAGKVTEIPVPTPRAGLTKIVTGPDGALWFAEASAMKIGRITTAGTITEFPTGFPYFEGYGITGLVVGPDGNLWLTARNAINRAGYLPLLGRLSPGGTFTWFDFPDVGDLLAGPDRRLWFIAGILIGAFAVPAQAAPPCALNDTTLCIDDQPEDRRFQISVTYQTTEGGERNGSGHVVPLSTLGFRRGGAIWFFSPDNPEMLVKILPACAVNGHIWVFASAGTNVGLALTVVDTVTGAARTYTNGDGTAALPVQDTSAFACSGNATGTQRPDPRGATAPAGDVAPPRHLAPGLTALAAAPSASCTPSDAILCIDGQPGDRRFQIQVAYRTAQAGGLAGSGHAVPLAPAGIVHGGAFWFFSADNPEMLVKVIDGCGTNGKQWFFASAGSNVGLTVTVTDTTTGMQRVYTNPDGTAALPVQDTSAFTACP
ncbi:MAG TPA: protease pro-enzyme activation domain-containing protein [Thermoanaerobaculia bacterium]|nr:protease pro-enzyme activation domain-containing protein [Thermoanaerobaculia bacterium]